MTDDEQDRIRGLLRYVRSGRLANHRGYTQRATLCFSKADRTLLVKVLERVLKLGTKRG